MHQYTLQLILKQSNNLCLYSLYCISLLNYSRMATAYTPDTEHGDDNFILELNRVKEKVRTRFIELTECLSK